MNPRRFQSLILACGLAIACGSARAEFTQNDLQIAGRALGFLDNPLSGDIDAGIVYAPGDPQSVREAEALKALLGQGLRVGNITLKPVLVPVADVGHANVTILLLTDGVTSVEAKAVTDAAKAKRTACITTDLAQVRNGVCAMGVRAQPRVEILVNRTAALSTGLSFSVVFRMMITET
jgi:hypothetical protein